MQGKVELGEVQGCGARVLELWWRSMVLRHANCCQQGQRVASGLRGGNVESDREGSEWHKYRETYKRSCVACCHSTSAFRRTAFHSSGRSVGVWEQRGAGKEKVCIQCLWAVVCGKRVWDA